jgi:hypothetical protein
MHRRRHIAQFGQAKLAEPAKYFRISSAIPDAGKFGGPRRADCTTDFVLRFWLALDVAVVRFVVGE